MFDVTSAPPAGKSPTHHPSETLEAGLRDSLDYQILRRTLRIEQEEPSAPASAEANETATVDAQAIRAASEASRFEQVLVEQRRLDVSLNAEAPPQKTDPLVLDLAGNGFATRGLDDPLLFDLNADGRQDHISAPSGDDALLALDRNGNGRIDDGKELFGDQHGAANGFAELARFDDNGDGRIDRQDSVFDRLLLLRFDEQGRQRTQSLSEAGVGVIHLQAQQVKQALGAYDEIAQLGSFEFTDGRGGQAADLLLARR